MYTNVDERAFADYYPNVDEFRELLRSHLSERGALARLSKNSGIASHVIGRWRDGHGRPTDTNLRKIAPFLGYAYEDLLKMCGYLDGQPVPKVNSELEARLTKLGTTFSQYPRAVWLAILEANERMADALGAVPEPNPPVSASPQPRISGQTQALTRTKHASGGGLTGRLLGLYPALAMR
jgi:hypothetical protein